MDKSPASAKFANILFGGLVISGTKIFSVAAEPVWQNNSVFLDIFFPFRDQSCYFMRMSFRYT